MDNFVKSERVATSNLNLENILLKELLALQNLYSILPREYVAFEFVLVKCL